MSDQLLTIGMITNEALMVLENQLTFTMNVTRQYSDQFGVGGAKIGQVLNVRKPVRFVDSAGQGLVLQDLTETSVPVVLSTQYQRSFVVTSADMTLNVTDFSKQFIRPAIASMSNQIDYDGMQQYKNIYNEVGTVGTPPASQATVLSTYLGAVQRLNEEAAPMDERNLVLSPSQQVNAVQYLAGLFNPQVQLGEQYKKGMMSKQTLGLDWYMDQNAPIHTVGALGGSPTVNSTAGQTGATLVTTGWTAAVGARLKRGDVFTIGSGTTGVYAVNPQNHQSTGALRQFVVTQDFASDGSGNGTVSISPSIITSGPFQTVVAAPAALATINLATASTASYRGLAFCNQAFTFACADLPLWKGTDFSDRKQSKQLGLSIRAIRDYDINQDRAPLRLDLLGGWATLYAEEAVRIAY